MELEGRLLKKRISGKFPEFGAIFVSNESTMKECFNRKLFGLPISAADYVERVKIGMILFLFEYEKRQLYGVFKATSDGELDIVPNAFKKSGRRFPAQVRFTTIWHCHSLREHEFRTAIRENYFAKGKFNFGLSKDQVQMLLWLFDSRKKIPLQLKREMEKDWFDHTKIVLKKLKPLADYGNSTGTKGESQLLDSGDSHIACEESDDMHCNSSHYPEGPCSESSLAFAASHISTCGQESGPFADYPIQSQPVPIGEELKEYGTSGNCDIDLGDYIPLLPSDDSDSEDSRASPESGFLMEGHLGLPVSDSGLYENAFQQDVTASPYAKLEENACSLKSPVANCEGNSNSDYIDSNTSVRGLYSDASNNRSSVFSRLNFSSRIQDEEETEVEKSMHTKVDKTAQEIMEELQQMHDKWKRNVRTSRSFGRQTDETSVFSRLNRTSETDLQDTDVPVKLVERHNEQRNMGETKKKSVFLRLSNTKRT